MANRERGESAFVVDGATYTLRLTTEAVAQLEDACSTPEREMFFPDILARMLRGSFKYTRLFLWAALREHHPGLTVKDVGSLIDQAGGIAELSEKIAAVVETTKPDPEDAARPPTAQATRAAGTGDRSTSRRARSS